jgi:hypothetical protein
MALTFKVKDTGRLPWSQAGALGNMEEAVIQSTEQGQSRQSRLTSTANTAVVRRSANPELVAREPQLVICIIVVPSNKGVDR